MRFYSRHRSRSCLRVGYIPLVDAAPLLLAREAGFFQREGLEVSLHQEPGWATIRDKLVMGELDAAHCLAGLMFAPRPQNSRHAGQLVTGLCLNTHGNTIALSKSLWDRGIRDGPTLAAAVKQKSVRLPMVFGAVHPLSSHIILLTSWLSRLGLKAREHYQVVFLPPHLMSATLRQGHLDGFCAGEPWGSSTAISGEGFIVATSDDVFPLHVEKVLAVTDEWATEQPEEVRALNRAVHAACRRCDEPGERENLVDLMAAPGNLSVPKNWIRNSLVGTMDLGFGRSRPVDDLHLFHGPEVNRPDLMRLGWVKQELARLGYLPESAAVDIRDHVKESLYPTEAPPPMAARPSARGLASV